MGDPQIDVLPSGAIVLGLSITADGFIEDRAIRIQSHCHADHMLGFAKSLRKDVILSQGLHDLLSRKYPQLPNRSRDTGIHILRLGEKYSLFDGDS